jgi:hypothetical protein
VLDSSAAVPDRRGFISMPHRSCTVSFEERGQRHEAKVDAESVYEAAVFALKQWNSKRYIKAPGRSAILEIEVVSPRKFQVRMSAVLAWLYSTPGKTKVEHERKQRLRHLLAERR